MTETVTPTPAVGTRLIERPGGRTPGPIDTVIGRRIRAFRQQRGLSQEVLAREVGVSAQQMHKYETAHNRISAAMLFMISRPLSVNAAAFFEGLGDEVDGEGASEKSGPERTGRRLRRFRNTDRLFNRGRRSRANL